MAYLFTSESVSEGHPDKVSDQISDALLDEFLAFDPQSKVACETLVTTGQVVVAGEVKSEARGYHIDDLPAVSLFGISSGYISIMVLVLYIHDLQASSFYSQPDWLWFVAVAILYWISHMWLLAFRGQMNEDPVLFAIRDKTSYIVSLFVMFSLYLAL